MNNIIIFIITIIFIILMVLTNKKEEHLTNNTVKYSADFIDADYDIHTDDQAHRQSTKQTFETKDYTQWVKYAFPPLTETQTQQLIAGENKYWTNQTLSYMRKTAVADRLWNAAIKSLIGDSATCIDATANIGGETLHLARHAAVKRIISYEPDPARYKILCENLEFFGVGQKCEARNGKFDYRIEPDSVVFIDPPFEQSSNMPGNFNLSIEGRPIWAIVEECLAAGARAVVLNMPQDYSYNSRVARDLRHGVVCWRVARKPLKVLVIRRGGTTVSRVVY